MFTSEIKCSLKQIKNYIQTKKYTPLGVGVQAVAYSHTNRSECVVKFISITGTNDPAYKFVQLCIDNRENPLFPKIYHVKMYPARRLTKEEREEFDKQDEIHSSPTANHYVLCVVTERLFKLTTPNLVKPALKVLKRDFGISVSVKNIEGLFEDEVDRQQLIKSSKHESFVKALQSLEPLFVQYIPDLHFDNWMVRKTRSGVDVVINDPIS